MPRKHKIALDIDAMGMWTMRALTCEANVLRKRLGEKPQSCRAGLSTKMQGAVPLSKCEHLIGEIADEDGDLVATCGFEDADAAKEQGNG